MAQGLALRQSFTLLFLATHSKAVRLVLRQGVGLLLYSQQSCSSCARVKFHVIYLRHSQQSCSSCAQAKRWVAPLLTAKLFVLRPDKALGCSFTHSKAVRLAPRQSVALLIWAQV